VKVFCISVGHRDLLIFCITFLTTMQWDYGERIVSSVFLI